MWMNETLLTQITSSIEADSDNEMLRNLKSVANHDSRMPVETYMHKCLFFMTHREQF